MLDQVRVSIREKDPSLEFYTTQIRPIIQHRWDRMNTPLHMAAYALNPYSSEEGRTIRRQWMQFSSLKGPFNKPNTREDHSDLGQTDPIGWCTMHGDEAPEIHRHTASQR